MASFIGGGFRMLTQPFRPFLAGTKVTQYVVMKNQQKEKEKEESRDNLSTMIKDGLTLSPPPTPVDLCAQARLTTATMNRNLTEKARSPTSPGFTYDGVTFTADISEFFAFEAPTSPPESDVDPTEVSLVSDVTMSDALVPTAASGMKRKSGKGRRSKFGPPVSTFLNTDASDFFCAPTSPPESDVDPSDIIMMGEDAGKNSNSNSSDGYISVELAEAAMRAIQSEPGLGPAISSVLKTGSVMPLVKEELRCTIQTKRLAKGKAELDLTEDDEPKNEKLTPEEEERRRRRRVRNKIAAQKCRDKKMEKAQELTKETEFLEKSNDNLRSEVQRLEDELFLLRNMLLSHDKSVQCGTTMSSNTTSTATSSTSTSTSNSNQTPSKTRSKTSSSRPSKRQRTK